MTNKTIEITKVISLRGPNIWTYRPALEAWIDIHDLEDFPSNTLPGFNDRLLAWLPGLAAHRCGIGEPGGFVLRLREGTWPAHILEHVTLELQNLVGMQTGFGKARQTSKRGLYKMVVRARHEDVSRACLFAARDLVMAAIEDRRFDMEGTVDKLHELADSLMLGPSTACIVAAATERRIPSIRLSEGNLVQLGYGVHSRRIWTAETDHTSAVAESISSDKDLTKRLLQSCGVPVPEGRIVSSPADAWEAAEEIGTPVAVKPSDGNHGRGVSIDISKREDVEAAYELAERHGSEVIVERCVPGDEHRLLVVGGRVVAATRGETAWVEGDGVSDIVQLVARQINSDPRRGTTEEFPLNTIQVEEDTAVRLELARQGFEPGSIPGQGQKVRIQRNGNVAIDVTDEVHPKVQAAASLAARMVGLDIAGVDLVAQDVSRPLDEQGGAIVEVNAGPGLLAHLRPAQGKPRPVGEAIVDHLFPKEASGRIPVVGITGSHGKTAVARLIARILKLEGKQVGLACSEGLFFGRHLIRKGDAANWASGHCVLLNRFLEAAVFENGMRSILREGLAYDRCQVGVITDIDPRDLDPDFFIEEPEQICNVLRTQVDVVLNDGAAVLNAEDPLVAKLAEFCDGEVIFFAQAPQSVADHCARGGRAVFLRGDSVVLADGGEEQTLIGTHGIPVLARHESKVRVIDVLAAIAAAWALDVSKDLIRAVVEGYQPGADGIVAITAGTAKRKAKNM